MNCQCVCVLLLSFLQDHTTSLMPRCISSEGVTNIMDLTVNCSLNAGFSKEISKTMNYSSYHGHAASVQTSSGNILGCGMIEPHFPVYAEYNGQIVLEQTSRYHLTRIFASPKFNIFQSTVLEGIAGTCSSEAAMFDPWMDSPVLKGNQQTPDLFKVGNLSNRQVNINYLHAPLIGSACTILGHAVCTAHHMNFNTVLRLINTHDVFPFVHKYNILCKGNVAIVARFILHIDITVIMALHKLIFNVHMMCYIHLNMQIKDSTSECKALKLSAVDPKCTKCTVEGFAMFDGPILSGMITFVSRFTCIHICHTIVTYSCKLVATCIGTCKSCTCVHVNYLVQKYHQQHQL